jgi:hypothetical protein
MSHSFWRLYLGIEREFALFPALLDTYIEVINTKITLFRAELCTLKIEAARSSGTLVFIYQIACHHILEDSNLHSDSRNKYEYNKSRRAGIAQSV